MNLTTIPTTTDTRRSGRATRSSLLTENVEITKVRLSESSTSEQKAKSCDQDSETISTTASQLYPIRSRGSSSSLRKRVHAQNGNIQKLAVPADPALEKVKSNSSNSAKVAATVATRRYPGSRQSQRLTSSWSTAPGFYNNPWREVSPAPRSTSHHEGSHLGTRTMKAEGGKVPTFCHHKYEDRKHRMMLDFLDRD